MIYYLIAVGICWFVFYSCYELLLARLTFFKINRLFLLGTLLLGLTLPLTPALDYFTPSATQEQLNAPLLKPVVVTMQAAEQSIGEIVVTPIVESSSWHWQDGLLLIYFAGLLMTGIRFVIGIERIVQLRRTGKLEQRNGYILVRTKKHHLPFSFFNYLFWSEQFSVEKADEERIIRHELAHIKGNHSLDVLLTEVVKMFFWFIPFIYLYKKALTEVHEYLADSSVINTFQKKKQYGLLLLRQSQSGKQIALANHFIHSQLKKRLLMMTRSQTRRSALWKYALILPLVGLLSYVFAQQQKPVQRALDKTANIIGYGTNGEIPDFDASQVYADFKYDLAILKNDASEKAQHEAYNVFSARYVKLMNDYPSHQQEIKTLAIKAINEMQAPFSIQASKAYDFDLVLPDWVTAQSKIQTAPSAGLAEGEEVFKVVEEMPRFPGCETEEDQEMRANCSQKRMFEFIFKNIQYPSLARKANVQGTVMVKFVVNKNGKIGDLQLIREVGGGCGDEAVRIISQMPTWIPGKQRGKAVNVEYVLPIKFKLDGEDLEPTQERIDFKNLAKPGAKERPLIVLNKKEVEFSEIEDLQPEEIQMVNVLKDQAATDKYGEKGANGVIEIVTKEADLESAKEFEGQEVFQVVEQMPRFPGCEEETDPQLRKNCSMKKMFEFIYQNIKYPNEAEKAGIEGTVVVKFIVDKTGAIRDLELTRDIGGGCGDVAMNVIESMPDWIPGVQKGKKVNVVFRLPIKFKLDSAKKVKKKKKNDTPASTSLEVERSLSLDNFSAFPNPAEEQLTIRFKGEKTRTTVTLIDATGKELFRDEQPQFSGNYNRDINLKAMSRGPVFIQVTQGDLKFVEKIMLQ